MRVSVTGRFPGHHLERLNAAGHQLVVWEGPRPNAAQLREFVAGADALISMLTDRIDAAVLDACPGLKVVANAAVGYDNIDVAECRRRGVLVGNTPGVLTEATADLTWALILGTARRVVEAA